MADLKKCGEEMTLKSFEILKKNGIYLFSTKAKDHAFFTGWKCQTDNQYTDHPVDRPDLGFVAQFCFFASDNSTDKDGILVLYANIPHPAQGVIPGGGVFDIGDERVFPEVITDQELEALLLSGYWRLMLLVAKHKAAQP